MECTTHYFFKEKKVGVQHLESIPSISSTCMCLLLPSLKPKFKDKRHCEMFVKLATVMKSSNSRFKDQLWLQDNTVNKHCFLHVTLDMFFKCPYRPVSNTFNRHYDSSVKHLFFQFPTFHFSSHEVASKIEEVTWWSCSFQEISQNDANQANKKYV